MIKGWRLDPSWRQYYDGRDYQKRQDKMMEQVVENQRRLVADAEKVHAENRQHNAECHARKEAAGELTSQQEVKRH